MNHDVIAQNLLVVDEHMRNEAVDPDLVMSLYTDDVVLEVPGRGLHLDTHEAIRRNYIEMFASLADVEIIPNDRFATAERVFDDTTVRFRLVGDGMLNAPVAKGTRVELRLLHVFQMRCGRIAREQVFETWKALD